MSRVIVIGAGLAGLSAALRLREHGVEVTLVAKGPGGLPLSTGTLDVFGYTPERVTAPLDAVASSSGDHPYALLGAATVRQSVEWLAGIAGPELLAGDPAANVHLPTAVGAIRPTCLAPASMVAGQIVGGRRYAVVGVRQLKDFQADLIAGNLARQEAPDGGPIDAHAAWIDLPARPGEADPSGLTYARSLDDIAFARAFAAAVEAARGACDVVLLPAVLGTTPGAWRAVADAVGVPIAEVAMQPPSVPGRRLHNFLLAAVRAAGVRVIEGSFASGFVADAARVTHVVVATAGRERPIAVDAVVHAPGGFESGALGVDSTGAIAERLFGLPLTHDDVEGLIDPAYWNPQPLFEVGVRTDASGRAVDAAGVPVWANLYAAGGLLAAPERWRHKTGDGIALASAVRAADSIAAQVASSLVGDPR